jgi:hypothetical protein
MSNNGAEKTESARRMNTEGIADEFLLVGVAPAGDGNQPLSGDQLKSVVWEALVATNMAQPFHTCRVKVALKAEGDAVASEILDKHVSWALSEWGKQPSASIVDTPAATARFIKALGYIP